MAFFLVIKGWSIRRMGCEELGLTLFNLELYFTLSFGWTLREGCVCVCWRVHVQMGDWEQPQLSWDALGLTIHLEVNSCWSFEWRSREGFVLCMWERKRERERVWVWALPPYGVNLFYNPALGDHFLFCDTNELWFKCV
jgi:hypothetical protein